MNRLARIEIGLGIAALALTVLACLFFVGTAVGTREICYGMTSTKLKCQPSDVVSALRYLVVLIPVLLLYVGVAAGAWFQHRAQEPSARSAAFGLLVTCALMIVGFTVPAISGPAFFLLPAFVAALLAALVGTVAFIRRERGVPAAS